MVDVRGDVLRPPHGTTPAAVKSNKNQKWDPLRYILELVACDIHHADKCWIIVGQKVTFLTVYTMFLEKISICLPKGSSNINWGMGPVHM